MSHWKKWIWPGILTVTILSLLAIWMKRDFIQDDLTAKATTALATNGQTWAKVEMDGRDAVLRGNAPSEEDRNQAAKITDGAYEVRVVDNQSGLVAAQSPYILRAKRDGDSVELTGFVPNEIVRGTVVDTAKELLPNAQVTDSLAIARGQPENFESLAGFGLTQLAGLKDGEISLSDKALSVKGLAKNRESYDAVNSALAGEVPSGGTLASGKITPPNASPYIWTADYSGEQLTLDGYVPSNAIRDAVVAHANSALPNVKIIDNQLPASGAPEEFEKATEYALKQLSRFKSGKVGLSDLNMSVSGVANSSENYTTALEAIGAATLPAGIVVADNNILPATVSPYTWSIEYDGKTAVLNGFIPDNSTRHTIVEQAKSSFGITDVTDNMQIADGVPSQFIDKTDFAFRILHNLSGGKASLSDNEMSITGVARDVMTFENANSMLGGALPAGLTLSESSISPARVSPYRWAAKYDGKTLALNGFVPDKAIRLAIRSTVSKILPGVEIKDNAKIAAGAPDDLIGVADFSIGQLARFSEGSVTLTDRNLVVDGVAKTLDDYYAAKRAVNAEIASGMKLTSENITPPVVSPYSWGLDHDGNVIGLTGFVPSEESRAKILEEIQAAFGAAKVIDNMQIAAGAPAAYDTAAASAIAILPKFSKGSVALSGTNLTVNGISKTSAHYLAAQRYLENDLPEQVNLVLANIMPPASQGDYSWQAKKSGSHIVLSGHVPSKADRERVAEAALKANPEISVVNRLTYETGAPQNFNANTELGLLLLAGLGEGTATISNEKLSVNGIAGSVASYEKTLAMMKDVEGEIQPSKVSPYSWSVKNAADAVILSGFVPNSGVGEINAAASKAVLNKPIENQQRVGGGAPDGFENAAAALIAGVETLDNGSATITDTNVFLEGRAESEEEAKRLADAVGRSLPANYSYRHQISFPTPEPAPEVKLKTVFVPKPVPDAPKVALKPVFVPKPVPDAPKVSLKTTIVTKPIGDSKPAVCTVDFMALIDGEKIQFDTAKAILDKNSYPLLDRVAEGLKECKNSRIEVSGHTDARGSERYNQELSEARAQAVVSYLTDKEGVSGDKLSAKGYGEQQPIAPNTDKERAENRRIEFKILDQ